jgi:NitT/TauT family transport system ATP-binding protein
LSFFHEDDKRAKRLRDIGNSSIKLSVSNLSLAYANSESGLSTQTIDDVSISVCEGEFVSIVGPSGCGKTSFLNVVAGLLKPSAGTVKINGKLVVGPGQDRTVVFQRPSLFPWKNVARNIAYGLELRGIKKKTALAQAEPYIKMVGLEDFKEFLPHQLSGGMQQRANLARALVCEPQVLLLDEPFAALDAITRESMQNELLDIWEKTRKTVLMVTHQIDEAVFLSDRIIIFTARPAQIAEEVAVPFGRPRDPSLRSDAEFDFISKQVWGLIHTTMKVKENIEYVL